MPGWITPSSSTPPRLGVICVAPASMILRPARTSALPLTVTATGAPGSVLTRVGQPFLHHSVGATERRGHWPGTLQVEVRPDRHPGRTGFLDQVRQLGETRLRQVGGLVGVVAEYGDDLAQFAERGGGRCPDHRCGLGDIGGWRVWAELKRPGMHAEQRQSVGPHVMHPVRLKHHYAERLAVETVVATRQPFGLVILRPC